MELPEAVRASPRLAEADGFWVEERDGELLLHPRVRDIKKLYVEPTLTILNDLQAIGLPATILIDRQGREIGRLLGPADWASPEGQTLVKAALAEKQ